MSVQNITLQVNGQPRSVAGLPAATLLVDLLREHLRLTGSHVGCDTAQCSACTPGLLMRAEAMRREGHPADAQAVCHALGGNLCRCTGYQGIVDAVCQVLAADASGRLPG